MRMTANGRRLCWLIAFFLTVTLVCFHLSTVEFSKNYPKSKFCEHELVKISLKHAALLIDEELLAAIAQGKCDEVRKATQIKVAYPNDFNDLSGDERLNVHTYKLEEHYMRIGDDRVVPRIEWSLLANNLLVPIDPLLFRKMLQRSKEIKCLGLKTFNETQRHKMLKEAMSTMVLIRDMLLTKSAFAYLEAGTLLGWYRDCDITPHTHDADLGILKEEYNSEIETMFLRRNQSIWVEYIFGKPENSRELRLRYEHDNWQTDLFVLYTNASLSWSGFTDPQAMIAKIPRYEPNCAAILNGHIFWVTCNVEGSLRAYYTSNWRIPVRKFNSMQQAPNLELIDKKGYIKHVNNAWPH